MVRSPETFLRMDSAGVDFLENGISLLVGILKVL